MVFTYSVFLQQVAGQNAYAFTVERLAFFTPFNSGTGAMVVGATYLPLSQEVAVVSQDSGGWLDLIKVDAVQRGAVSSFASLDALPSGAVTFFANDPLSQRNLMALQPSSQRTAQLYDIEWVGGTTLIGVANAAACAGESVDIVTQGYSPNHQALLAGQFYALSSNGTMVPAAGVGPYPHVVGMAISRTEMDVTVNQMN